MSEHELQNKIRLALSPYAVVFRINVGSGFTYDGRYLSTGVPKGYSDLSGFRKGDGKAFFIEVKTPKGRVSKEQKKFLKTMNEYGAITGVARSVDDAIKILREEL